LDWKEEELPVEESMMERELRSLQAIVSLSLRGGQGRDLRSQLLNDLRSQLLKLGERLCPESSSLRYEDEASVVEQLESE